MLSAAAPGTPQATALSRSAQSFATVQFGGLIDAELSIMGAGTPPQGAPQPGLLETVVSALQQPNAGASSQREALRAALAPETPAGAETLGFADTIVETLSELETRLTEALELLEDDAPPTPELLATLTDLVTQIKTALGQPGEGEAAQFARLDTQQRTALGDLFDRVANLATRAATALGDDVPATPQLLEFARLLDRHAAALPPPETAANPDMLLRLARAETAEALPIEPDTATSTRRPEAIEAVDTAREPKNTDTPDAVRPTPDTARPTLSAADAAPFSARPDTAMLIKTPPAEAALDPAIEIVALPQQSTTAASPIGSAAVAPAGRPEAQVNLPYVAAEIARHVGNGTSRFEIRLNPPEMGRIDVRLEFDNSGNVTARLAVERTETLDLMQRDQRTLERALSQAGLDAGKTSLEFSLMQGGDDRGFSRQFDQDRGNITPSGSAATTGDDAEPSPSPQALYRGYVRADAVNLWI